MEPEPEPYVSPCDAVVISARWGKLDIKSDLETKYSSGQREFDADNDEWGEGWYGYLKSLVITYDVCGKINTVAVKENSSITLP